MYALCVCRPFSLAVGRLKKKKKKKMKKKKMEKIGRFPYVTLAMFSSYFLSVSRYRST